MSAGTAVRARAASTPTTTTAKVAPTGLLSSSSSKAVQVTMVVPTGNVEPDGGLQSAGNSDSSSEAMAVGGVYSTTTGTSLETVMLSGTPTRIRSSSS